MDTLFFWLSKLAWFLLSPLNFILLGLTLAFLLLVLNKRNFLVPFSLVILICLYLIALFPLGSWLLHPLETRFQTNPQLPEKIDGIIVLSGALNADKTAEWKQTQVNGAVDRELAFMKLARHYPGARLVYTGGSSRLIKHEARAADTAKQLFRDLDFNAERVIFERDSRNTWENAKLSFAKAQPASEENWVLVTSAYHMPRSIGVFCKTGWPMIPYPVDHYSQPSLSFKFGFTLAGRAGLLDMAIHEWLGLLAYRLSGKTDALLPDTCLR